MNREESAEKATKKVTTPEQTRETVQHQAEEEIVDDALDCVSGGLLFRKLNKRD